LKFSESIRQGSEIQKVIKDAKECFMRKNNGRLYSEACGFDFFNVYGERGKNFIEVHHTKLVSELSNEDKTRVRDVAMIWLQLS
jgi:predicted HNH restriction endonuclease